MLPRAKNAFLALSMFSWTAREANRLYYHQTSKHLAVGVVEISMPVISNFSGSLYCCDILRTPSLDAFSFRLAFLDTFLLAHSTFRCSSSQVISMDSIAAPT